MTTGLIFHTGWDGTEITHTKEDLKEAAKIYHEVIVLAADTANLTNKEHNRRMDEILEDLPRSTEVFLPTANLTKTNQLIPDIEHERNLWDPLWIKGTYFNQESIFHPQFLQILKAIKKCQRETIWIPYTGSYWKSFLTLPQIAFIARKFDKIYLQPNYFQTRYGKCRKCAENLARFCKIRNYGIEFEIDASAIACPKKYERAKEYFDIYKDFKQRAFYTGGLTLPVIKENLPEYYKEMKK